MKWLILTVLVAAVVAEERYLYPGYRVYDLYPSNENDVAFLHDLMISRDDLDFWVEPNHMGMCTVMVPPDSQDDLLATMAQLGIGVETKHDDLEKFLGTFWEEYDTARSTRDPEMRLNFDGWNTYAEIEAWMTEITSGTCSAAGFTCTKATIGTTHEGRAITRLTMSTGSGKPSFWLDSTIHAREWLAPATILKVMNRLLTGYGSDSEVTALLNGYDWHFVPVFNPDGYAYTQTQRYWRKNRATNPGSTCLGTDLNRNHAYNWGRQGVSTAPCNDIFCGSSACSERECQAVQGELQRLSSSIQVMMTFHSYGNMWMHPWGNHVNFNTPPCERASDHNDMFALAGIAASAIQGRYNTRWSYGTSCEVIYPTTGGTDDWAKGVPGIKYAICPELRGNDFVVATSQIDLSFQEIWAGLVAQEGGLP